MKHRTSQLSFSLSLSIRNRISDTQYFDKKMDSPISKLVVPHSAPPVPQDIQSIVIPQSISLVDRSYEYETAFTHSGLMVWKLNAWAHAVHIARLNQTRTRYSIAIVKHRSRKEGLKGEKSIWWPSRRDVQRRPARSPGGDSNAADRGIFIRSRRIFHVFAISTWPRVILSFLFETRLAEKMRDVTAKIPRALDLPRARRARGSTTGRALRSLRIASLRPAWTRKPRKR